MVERLIYSDTTSLDQPPRVIGVELRVGPKAELYCTGVNREVILCAGTVGTCQLLLLSGLGPAEDLQKLKIPVRKDLPAVGQNVIDVRFLDRLMFSAHV